MTKYRVNVPVEELCALIRHEAEGNYVNFHVNGRKQFLVSEHAAGQDRRPRKIALIKGTLNVEPLAERNHWVLRIEATRDLGPADRDDEAPAPESALSVDDFEEEFLAGDTEKSALVLARTDTAHAAFEYWLHVARLHTINSTAAGLRAASR
ncbi:MAG TPA: hypothetical protein VMV26_08500 [Alphaproteobacteria bacterium]|nr:hypothetical protein [Alphaproteobacteria bacterium]